MKLVVRLFLLAAFLPGPMASGQALAQSARVAVSGDASLANLVDVTTSQLSSVPGLSLLERADLDKLGRERELQAALSSEDYSQLQILPADGLVLLRAASSDGKRGVFARLVAVQPGVVLREVALPEGGDPLKQAQAVATEFAPYWSKLAALQKGKADALSLLGLRFEVDSPDTRELERSMNLLLASRLSAEPDVIVLERWRLNDAVFEKTLSAQQPAPFWTGSSLIDGTMRMKGGRIEVNLRLRPAQGPEVSIQDSDTAQSLPALVERLAGKIRGGRAGTGEWKPSDEARHFADLGKWCLDNGLPQEGAEAVETAWAMGEHERTVRMLQVKAYAMQSYPDGLGGFLSVFKDYRVGTISPDSLPQRIGAAQKAAILMRDYLKDYPDVSSPAPSPEDSVSLGVPVFFDCVRVLRAAYEHGFQADHAEALTDLRHAIQELVVALDERLLPQPSSPARRAYLNCRDAYAALWNETPEKTLSFYRKNLEVHTQDNGLRGSLYAYDSLHPPFLDEDQAVDTDQESRLIHAAPDFRDTPYLVAWDGRPAGDIKVLWQKFLDELAASPDPLLQADALKLELRSTLSDARRTACVARFADFMQQHADNLSGPGSEAFAAGLDPFFYWASDRKDNADARQKLSALYVSLMKKHVDLPPEWIHSGIRFLYGGDRISNDEARELLSALDDYMAWCNSQTPQGSALLNALAEMRQTIFRSRTELQPTTEVADALPVNRFWSSAQTGADLEKPGTRPLFVDPRTLTVSEGDLWFMNRRPPYQIFSVDPATLQVVSSFTIPDELESVKTGGRLNVQSLDVSPQWLAVAVDDHVFLCSRATSQWRQLDLPPFIYKPRFVGQELYLLYQPTYDPKLGQPTTTGSGLMRISLPAGTAENVISSHRVPPQTALDGKPLGNPMDLWMTPGGLTMAVNGIGADEPRFQAYATPPGKNDWTLWRAFPERSLFRLVPEGALLLTGKNRNSFEQLTWLGPEGNETLLANPELVDKKQADASRWDFPEDMHAKALAKPEQISAVMRGGDLCLYDNVQSGAEDGKEASLYYLARGRKDGLKIPLAFDLATMKAARPNWKRMPTPSLNFENLQATDYGLMIYGMGDPGFWVIPWSDIDAYRARTGSDAKPK